MAASSSSLPRWKYDVFLSFRGKDTRKNFVDHLYMALQHKGIYTFKDDEKLERGKWISPNVLKAIKGSKIAVIVFSKNYASSSWCLDELVEIIECKNTLGQTILPVFYNMDPSQVQKQKRSFAKAFGEHEETFGKDNKKVQRWRAALVEAANLRGWNLKNTANRQEAKFIQEIVREILKFLGRIPLNVARYEVGINSRVDKVITLLDNGLKDVLIVGICGIGGIGKTTIAKAVFNKIFDQFDSYCFLGNVREESENRSLTYLQRQLLNDILDEDLMIWHVDYGINVIKQRLYYKKVLVVLDDVDDVMQLKSLVGGKDWFGFGSRIIVTTRDERLLIENKVDHVIYRVELLNDDEALQLFSHHAFSRNYPAKDFLELSSSIRNYANGLPLALEVLGSSLFDRSTKEWEKELDNLKRIPNEKIHNVLKITFDGLNHAERELFLDIACFFKGYDKDYVMNILSSGEFHPRIAVLIERSLITISINNQLLMHDLIEEMGKEIVRQESLDNPGERSRLWFHEDICKVLGENTATESIKGIMLQRPYDHRLEEVYVNVDAFVKMKRLKLLKLSGIRPSGHITYLSNELYYFDWDYYPTKVFPSNFHPRNLVHLGLPHNQIKKNCFPIKILEKLRFLNLSNSLHLNKTPDLFCLPYLENLDLSGCTNLVELQLFSGVHEMLVKMSLSGCWNLRILPRSIKFKNLKYFDLSGCSKLERFPDIQGDMDCLTDLYLDGTAIKELPLSIKHLNGLRVLTLDGSRKLMDLGCLYMKKGTVMLSPVLSSLRILNLRKCNFSEEMFPSNIGLLSSLEELDLSENSFVSIPERFIQLTKLKKLLLQDCKNLRTLISLPSSIRHVNADGCKSLQKYWFPPSVGSPDGRKFIFTGCHKLVMDQRNNMSNRLLESQLQKIGEIILPGSDIPHWFSYESEGESTSMCLRVDDHNLPFYYNVKGIAVCAVLECDGTSSEIGFDLKVNGYSMEFRAPDIPSDVFVLIQKTQYYDEDEGVIRPIKNLMNNTPKLSQDGCYIEVSIISPPVIGQTVKVKKLGIHLVME